MRKIINGRKYDTETATRITSCSNDYYSSDFRSCTETLFKKRTGEFFLYGEGGPASKYGEPCPGGYGYGEDIIPLTEEEAMDWVEENASADIYEELFGLAEE